MDRSRSFTAVVTADRKGRVLVPVPFDPDDAIKEAAPDAAETISYRVPTFSQGGPLVGFGAAKNHCSFYVMSPSLVSSLGDELKPYDVSGATIRFKVGEPLPPSLVTRVVVARIEENAARKKS